MRLQRPATQEIPVTSASSSRAFRANHVQIARAVFAAIAAIMVTFSPDHSAVVGMAVFSGFAIATGIVHLLAVWLVYPAGLRWPSLALGIVTLLAGMIASLGPVRTITGFYAVVVTWALMSGLIELLAGWAALRRARPSRPATVKPGHVEPWSDGTPTATMPRGQARDAVVTGVLGLVLGTATLCVPAGYALNYTVEAAQATFTLTGITIAVGLFGGYAAIVAVYLGIAGFSPRPAATPAASEKEPV